MISKRKESASFVEDSYVTLCPPVKQLCVGLFRRLVNRLSRRGSCLVVNVLPRSRKRRQQNPELLTKSLRPLRISSE